MEVVGNDHVLSYVYGSSDRSSIWTCKSLGFVKHCKCFQRFHVEVIQPRGRLLELPTWFEIIWFRYLWRISYISDMAPTSPIRPDVLALHHLKGVCTKHLTRLIFGLWCTGIKNKPVLAFHMDTYNFIYERDISKSILELLKMYKQMLNIHQILGSGEKKLFGSSHNALREMTGQLSPLKPKIITN